MLNTIKDMGLLRNGLHALALIFALLMPLARGPDYSDSWNLFFSGILPATAPIIVIVIGFDILMSSIFRSEATPERAAQLTAIIRTHQIVGGILLGMWLLIFLPVMI